MAFNQKIFLSLSIFFFLGGTACYGTPTGTRNETKWTNEVSFDTPDEDNFTLKWNAEDSQWLVMEMTAPTGGYVAIGFSPDGGMNNSDIVMGWVDAEGKGQIKDLHGIGNTKPVEDTEKDYELLHAEEAENKTVVQFRRRWNTCDEVNDKILDGTLKVIWAYGKVDPKLADDDGVFRPPYHFTTRGASSADDKVDIKAPASSQSGDDCALKKLAI